LNVGLCQKSLKMVAGCIQRANQRSLSLLRQSWPE
jgi:hypothetical protein